MIEPFLTAAARLAAATILAAGVAGCVSPVPREDGRYADPIGGAPVIDNQTPYSEALACLSAKLPAARPRIAVGEIADFTGKFSSDTGSPITQGAALMAMSALGKAGLPMVERYDIKVAETELKLANNNLIGEGEGIRIIRAGSIPGSQFYLVGGITELNSNIDSVAADVFIYQGGIGGRLYVLNVALDLRLVETETLRVVEVVSYQKQILGREVRAGIFEFFDSNLVDLSVSERALEPMQLAVRAMVEKAVGDLARRLFGMPPKACVPAIEGDA